MNNIIKVGILGANGNIGSMLLKLISAENSLVVFTGCRSNLPHSKNHICLDVNNLNELENFIEPLDVIVNCIGPSYVYSEYISSVVNRFNKKLIDPFGANITLKNISNPCIIFSGDFPGFTGMILKYISNYFDLVSECDFYYKVIGEFSISAFSDFIDSVIHGFGKSGYYYKDGTFVKAPSNMQKCEFIDKNAVVLDFFNEEFYRIAKELEIKKLSFKNIYESEKLVHELGEIITNKILDNNFSLQEVISKNQISSKNMKSVSYFVKALGIKNNIHTTCSLTIKASSSELISAHVLKECLFLISNIDCANRLYEPHMLIDINSFIEKLVLLNVISIEENNGHEEISDEIGII